MKELNPENPLVVIDLDNTLVDTVPLFTAAYQQFRDGMKALLDQECYQGINAEDFINRFFQADQEIFSQGRVDVCNYGKDIIGDLLLEYRVDNLFENRNESNEFFDNLEQDLISLLTLFDSIYSQAPPTFPDTVELLKTLHQAGIPFLICSHSGKDWLGIKIASLSEECGFNLPSYAIDLKELKDEYALLDALEMFNEGRRQEGLPEIQADNSWMIGDSLKSDIYSAFFAEFAGAIWLNWLNEQLARQDYAILSEAVSDGWQFIEVNNLSVIPHLLGTTHPLAQAA